MNKLATTYLLVAITYLGMACATRAPLTTGRGGLATWWGKNLVGNYLPSREQDLETLCKTSQYDVIYLSGMVDHFGTRSMPSLHLGNFCNASNAFPGYMTSTKGFTLPKCPRVEAWIAACQEMGKKVLLSVSPMHETLKSDADGVKSAQNVWNMFLGGTSDTRPFGKVVLDGVDVAHRTNEVGYIGFMNELRRLMDADTHTYSLGISPECAFPSPRFGPTYDNTILKEFPTTVDFMNLMHLSSQVCSWGNQDLFWKTATAWATWTKENAPQIQILSSFPIIGWGYEAWINAMTGDFVPVEDIYEKSAVPNLKSQYGQQFGGVALHDSSADQYNMPCVGSITRYSSIWASQIAMSIAEAGKNTADKCIPKSGNQIIDNRPTLTATSSTRRPTGTNIWKPTSGPTYQPGQSTSQGLSTAAIAGIGVGVSVAVVGVGLVIGLAVMKMRKGRKDEEAPKSPKPDSDTKPAESKPPLDKPAEKAAGKPAAKPVEVASKPEIQKTTTTSEPKPATQPAASKPVAKPAPVATQPKQTAAPSNVRPSTGLPNYAMMKPVKNSLK